MVIPNSSMRRLETHVSSCDCTFFPVPKRFCGSHREAVSVAIVVSLPRYNVVSIVPNPPAAQVCVT